MPSHSHKICKYLLHFLPKSLVSSKIMSTQHFPLEGRIIMIKKMMLGSSPLCAFHPQCLQLLCSALALKNHKYLHLPRTTCNLQLHFSGYTYTVTQTPTPKKQSMPHEKVKKQFMQTISLRRAFTCKVLGIPLTPCSTRDYTTFQFTHFRSNGLSFSILKLIYNIFVPSRLQRVLIFNKFVTT